MKFIATALLFAAATLAMPSAPCDKDGKHSDGSSDDSSNNITYEQASAKCGNDAVVSCCNKETVTGSVTSVNNGLLAGVLSNAIAGGPGSDGLGLFNGCSDLSLGVPVASLLSAQNILNKKCQQSIACCQNSRSEANGDLVGVALPCVALGSLI
ncbi:Hydrophobin [Penicillium diatomitis]|uniref:Hydrophobin n=1 Tax=Penicillium diatomitis TaxID=2819901 RepID=A0A9W9XFD5_9EURO|nr:Hydrophobin [Penicillium diatomitis]KAJ5490718.1 Hydrophobin [Penicillium diatomitis]